jgi:hypothetical protein
MVMKVSISPRSSRISPLLENKRTIASAAVSENSVKIRASLFPCYEGLIKGHDDQGQSWALSYPSHDLSSLLCARGASSDEKLLQ